MKCKCSENSKYDKKGPAWSMTDKSGTRVCYRCGTVDAPKYLGEGWDDACWRGRPLDNT